jgi:hypothetical protein
LLGRDPQDGLRRARLGLGDREAFAMIELRLGVREGRLDLLVDAPSSSSGRSIIITSSDFGNPRIQGSPRRSLLAGHWPAKPQSFGTPSASMDAARRSAPARYESIIH